MATPVLTPDQRSLLVGRLKPVYQTYRTALLNRLYYGAKLGKLKKWSLGLDIIGAVGTATTSIGVWKIFSGGTGKEVWAVIAGAATLIGVIKPVLQLPKAIEGASKLFTGHTEVYFELQRVVHKIAATQSFSIELEGAYDSAFERYKKLNLEDDAEPSKNAVKTLEEEVMHQIPNTALWYPPKNK